MKSLPAALAAHLASGATTLCWCWRLTRRDGIQLGFTDHDRPLTFEGTTFEAASGFSASEIKDTIGLSVANLEVSSALSSDSLVETDLVGGLYDDASVQIYRVNWMDPAQRILMRAGSLGQVKRAGLAFTGEVRGLAHYLQQPKGRLYQFSCDALLGDARCGIALSSPAYTGHGTITAVTTPRAFIVSGLQGYQTDWFTRGLLTFTSGAANGQSIEVKTHAVQTSTGTVLIELWSAARLPVSVGQTFTIQAGCDKSIDTCTSKFANAVNHRGFPTIPGNDFVVSSPIA